MTNLRNKARTILEFLKRNGFNGIKFRTVILEGSDWPEDDNETQEQRDEHNMNYAIFILEPEFPILPPNSTYERHHFDEDFFYDDLKDYFSKQFGREIKVKHYENCSEWEISR